MTRESAQTDLGTIAARLARQFPDTNRNLVPVARLYTETDLRWLPACLRFNP